jgi:hypothetical protein
MPLDVVRLRDSDLATTPDGEVFRVAVMSWCASWHQVPASSLPDNDAILARLMGFGRDLKGWKKVREAGGLRGWKLHSDGRLYHPVVAEKALEAMGQKSRAKTKRERDAKRLKDWRDRCDETRTRNDADTGMETHGETRFVAERQDRTLPDLTLPKNNTPPPSPGGSSRERDAGADAPTPPGDDGGGAPADQKSENIKEKLTTRINGLDKTRLKQALNRGELLPIVAQFGANTKPDRVQEWVREANGHQLGTILTILWLASRMRQPIREPSGLRIGLATWLARPQGERAEVIAEAMIDLGINQGGEGRP